MEFTLFSQEKESWLGELKDLLKKVANGRVRIARSVEDLQKAPNSILFISSRTDGLEDILLGLDRKGGRAVFLVSPDSVKIPKVLKKGLVDDVLVHPFRVLEVVGRLHYYQEILMWDEVRKLNEGFSEIVDRLRDDLKLAERIHRAHFPRRFGDVKGFKIRNRYLAGLRSGGDFFDIDESTRDSGQLSVVLTDSSSYGLSGAVLALLMGVASRLSAAGGMSTYEVVSTIFKELSLTLGEKDHLSMFYGLISRKDLELRYLNSGTCRGFLSKNETGFDVLKARSRPLSRTTELKKEFEQRVQLDPKDRLVLVSDGFLEMLEGVEGAQKCLNRFRKKPAEALLNELTYQVKSRLGSEEQFPEQDCTAIVMDVDSRVVRLVS